MSFLENSISNKNQIAEICLKKYILDSSKTLQMDALLLRHASSVTRDNIKKITKTTDHELLNNLNEKKMLEEEVLSGIPGYHRYVFGVSHSNDLHRASPNTTVIHCGAGTMFSIGDPESRTNHFQTINSALKTINPQKSLLIFEFGEIDIRNHIFKIAKRNIAEYTEHR